MTEQLDNQLLAHIETRAVELARGAGEILSRYFGGNLSIEFKDDRGRDPVTNADTESQEFLEKGIRESFPDHGILGEEDDESKAAEDEAVPDFSVGARSSRRDEEFSARTSGVRLVSGRHVQG